MITIDDLLEEYNNNRQELKKMIQDLEKVKEGIESLFPERFDVRYRRLFEEKVKAATELFKALLDMRKELSKSLKDEIEMRRKLDQQQEEDMEVQFNVRALADAVDKMNKEKHKEDLEEDKKLEERRKRTLLSIDELTNTNRDPLTILTNVKGE